MQAARSRYALLAALALAVGACSADRAVAPAPPSLATGATPIHQEPTPLPPMPDSTSRCMKFDSLPLTRWGAVPGTAKGVVVHAENNIRMKLTDYVPASGSLQYRHALVVNETRYPDVLFGNSLRLDTIGVVFDFTSVPFVIGSVTFTFVDRSPLENLAVDGSPVHLGQVKDWPTQATPVVGHTVAVALAPNSPVRGTVGIAGDLDSIRVGGSNDIVPGDQTGLWLDNVCVNKAGLSSQHQNPYPL